MSQRIMSVSVNITSEAVAEHDLEEAESWPEIFDEVGLLDGGGRQVGTTGKLPESSVECSSVQIFTRDRFEVTEREGREKREEREREREREREIKKKGIYKNYPVEHLPLCSHVRYPRV